MTHKKIYITQCVQFLVFYFWGRHVKKMGLTYFFILYYFTTVKKLFLYIMRPYLYFTLKANFESHNSIKNCRKATSEIYVCIKNLHDFYFSKKFPPCHDWFRDHSRLGVCSVHSAKWHHKVGHFFTVLPTFQQFFFALKYITLCTCGPFEFIYDHNTLVS